MAGPTNKMRRDRESVAFSLADAPLPPHSVEAEQAVLGGLLLDPAAWDNVADVILPEDFYRPDHKLIFQAIAALATTSKPSDVVTVVGELERRSELEQAGGLAYIGSLARETPTAANVRAYADIVRERSILRQLVTAGTEIAGAVFNNDGETARELVDKAEQKVFEIAEMGFRGKGGAQPVRSLLPGVIDQIDEAFANPDKLRGLPTGFTDFDRMTGGLRPGDLVIIAGRPSMGKSTFAVNMAEYAALHPREKPASVAIFSLEMPSEQIITRMLSSIGGVPLQNLRSGKISDDDWVRITSATSQLSEAKIFIDETPALSPMELRARARRVKREHGLDLILVDYLQLMQVPGNKESRATEIGEISRGLKILAKELSCPVIALSQLNRSVEQRENKKPVMSDLRECVTGDTLVCLADGRRIPIQDLVGQTPEVVSMTQDGRLTRAKSDLVWKVGRKPVFELKLASGRKIRATGQHRLYASFGWQRVDDLRPGDRLAIARQIPEPLQPDKWSDDRITLLAHMIGDGSYPVHQPMRYTTASEACSEVVRRAAENEFGMTVTRYPGRGNWHQLVLSGNGNRWKPAGVNLWLRELGIYGQRSLQKRVPAAVFKLSNEQIALFLRHLWATDGTISPRSPGQRGGHGVHFSTCSRGLADDVAALPATNDIFWDRIVEVESVGEEDVFDLTVPDTSCWLADGIVSHNSGSIEQDADMILLIYREEVYDRQTTKKGIAEIDLVKHRNGEIGTFVLTFQGQFTRFANYVPDTYGDGVLR